MGNQLKPETKVWPSIQHHLEFRTRKFHDQNGKISSFAWNRRDWGPVVLYKWVISEGSSLGLAGSGGLGLEGGASGEESTDMNVLCGGGKPSWADLAAPFDGGTSFLPPPLHR